MAEIIKKRALSFISLGSNYGDREKQLSDALTALGSFNDIFIEVSSDMYQTPPTDLFGNSYYNQCAGLYTLLSPCSLLERLNEIEAKLGRKRNYLHSIRNIDLDIILYENSSIKTARLTLPHPESWKRPFVIIPLAEIQTYKNYEIIRKFLKNVDFNDTENIIKLNIKGGLHG